MEALDSATWRAAVVGRWTARIVGTLMALAIPIPLVFSGLVVWLSGSPEEAGVAILGLGGLLFGPCWPGSRSGAVAWPCCRVWLCSSARLGASPPPGNSLCRRQLEHYTSCAGDGSHRAPCRPSCLAGSQSAGGRDFRADRIRDNRSWFGSLMHWRSPYRIAGPKLTADLSITGREMGTSISYCGSPPGWGLILRKQ